MESIPDTSVHIYMILIIILVVGVPVWIMSTMDAAAGGESGGPPPTQEEGY